MRLARLSFEGKRALVTGAGSRIGADWVWEDVFAVDEFVTVSLLVIDGGQTAA